MTTPPATDASIRWASGFLFLLLSVVGTCLYRDYGISWDEPYQRTIGAVSVKAVAERIAPSLLTDAIARQPDLDSYRDRDYGVAFEAPAVILEQLLGLTDDREIFMFRHLLTHLVFLAGVVAVFRLAARRHATWWAGLLAAALLVLTPRMFAESFYNSKDIVFMAAYAMATATMIGFLLRPEIRTALLHAFATAFAIDVRIMGIVLPVATAALLAMRAVRREIDWPRALALLLLFLAASAEFVVLMFPWLWDDPVRNLTEAFANMARFRWNGEVRYLGELIPAAAIPWHYVPVWIAITVPLPFLALFTVGVFAILQQVRSSGSLLWRSDGEMQDLVLLAFCIAPIVAVIALGSVLYDGWRHLYFIYPAFILVATRGWMTLWNLKLALARPMLATLTVVAGASSLHWMVEAHPLQNVYFNALAGRDAGRHFDLDYWGLGNRQALEFVLASDDRPEIRIHAASATPLENSLRMVHPADRARIRVIQDRNDADYVLTNYRSLPAPRLAAPQSDASPAGKGSRNGMLADPVTDEGKAFFRIDIDGHRILTVFRQDTLPQETKQP